MSRNLFLTYEKARAKVRRLGLGGMNEYHAWRSGQLREISGRKLPPPPPRGSFLPYNPASVYAKSDFSWGDYLGHGRGRGRPVGSRGASWLSYREARRIVRGTGLSSHSQFEAWARGEMSHINGRRLPNFPENMPKNPYNVYGEEFLGWDDFLGKTQLAPFKKARTFARALGIMSWDEWTLWHRGKLKRNSLGEALPPPPPWMPLHIHSVYKKDFLGLADFLGYHLRGKVQRRGRPQGPSKEVVSFLKARRAVRALQVETVVEYREWWHGEKPEARAGIPFNPASAYRKQWRGWADFLGHTGGFGPRSGRKKKKAPKKA